MIAGTGNTPPALPWADITRLLVHEVTRAQLLQNSSPHPQPGAGHPQDPQQAGPSAIWSPSATAHQLAEIVGRHPEGPPRLSFILTGKTPETLARALQEAISHSGLSHHRQLADGVHNANLSTLATTIPAAGPQSFEATAMLLMTGQLRTTVETPIGPAVMVWHREDANPSAGTTARVCAVSVAIDHPLFGPLIAHLSLGSTQLEVRLHCDQSKREELEQHVGTLHQQLGQLQRTTSIHVEGTA